MVVTRKKLTSEEWRTLNAAWLRSGMEQKAFCALKGVNHKSFVNWRSRNKATLANTSNKDAVQKPNLIPVKVVEHEIVTASPQKVVQSSATDACPCIRITTHSGYTVQVPDTFSEKTLLRVLKVIGTAGD